MNILKMDHPAMRALAMLGNLIVLNILWLICCLPVITAGASTAALYTVALKFAQDDDGFICRRFFHAFRQNFRQATAVYLVVSIIGIFLTADFYIYAHNKGTLSDLLLIFLVILFMIGIVFSSWFYPILAQFENTVGNTCVNALKLSVIHLTATFRITMTNIIFCLTFYILWKTMPNGLLFWLMLGASGAAYLNSFSLRRCFAHYIPENDSKNLEIMKG